MSHVCFINFNVYCLFNAGSSAPMGGIELDIYNISTSLAKSHQVSIITADWGQAPQENFGQISIHKSIKLGKDGSVKALYKLWKLMKRIDADVYISSGAGPEVGIISFFCRLHGKKYIYRTASRIDCDGTFARSKAVKGIIYGWGLKNSDRIVTSVKSHKELLVKQGIKARKIINISLGIYLKNENSTTQQQKIIILFFS